MERALQWIVVVAVCASSTIIHAADEAPHRKLASVDYSGTHILSMFILNVYISIKLIYNSS